MTPRPSDIVRSNFTHPRNSGGGSLANNQFVMWNILSRNNSIGQTWQLSLWQNASTTIQQFATNKSPNLVKTYYNAMLVSTSWPYFGVKLRKKLPIVTLR